MSVHASGLRPFFQLLSQIHKMEPKILFCLLFLTFVSQLQCPQSILNIKINYFLLKNNRIVASILQVAPASHCGQPVVIVGGGRGQTDWLNSVTEGHRALQLYNSKVEVICMVVVVRMIIELAEQKFVVNAIEDEILNLCYSPK